MPTQRSSCQQRPRELRRLVIMPARLRTSAGWGNACILNISSRGMLVHAGRPVAQGNLIELRHGPYAIVARVVWHSGSNFGAETQTRIPIEAIAAAAVGNGYEEPRWDQRRRERRMRQRAQDRHRIAGRAMEFAAIALIGGSLAAGFAVTIEQALAQPLGYVVATLSR